MAHAYEQSKVDNQPKVHHIYKNMADEMGAIKAEFEAPAIEP